MTFLGSGLDRIRGYRVSNYRVISASVEKKDKVKELFFLEYKK
jgi:hypothetical protein